MSKLQHHYTDQKSDKCCTPIIIFEVDTSGTLSTYGMEKSNELAFHHTQIHICI